MVKLLAQQPIEQLHLGVIKHRQRWDNLHVNHSKTPSQPGSQGHSRSDRYGGVLHELPPGAAHRGSFKTGDLGKRSHGENKTG